MWMAEWFFTDFFKRRVTAARRTRHRARANLGPLAAIHTDGADCVAQPRQGQHECEQNSEEKFRGKQFANEIELQHEENRQAPAHAFSDFLILPRFGCKSLQFR